MMEMYKCPCGWRMPTSSARAVAAHRDTCLLTPRAPFDPDAIIDQIADGKPLERELNTMERWAVLDRMFTMPNDKWADVFLRPFQKQVSK